MLLISEKCSECLVEGCEVCRGKKCNRCNKCSTGKRRSWRRNKCLSPNGKEIKICETHISTESLYGFLVHIFCICISEEDLDCPGGECPDYEPLEDDASEEGGKLTDTQQKCTFLIPKNQY